MNSCWDPVQVSAVLGLHPDLANPKALLGRLFRHQTWRKPAHPNSAGLSCLQMNSEGWEFQCSRTFVYVFNTHSPVLKLA